MVHGTGSMVHGTQTLDYGTCTIIMVRLATLEIYKLFLFFLMSGEKFRNRTSILKYVMQFIVSYFKISVIRYFTQL